MAGTEIKPGTPASLVWCSTTELSRPISTVHLAQITTIHSHHYLTINFFFEKSRGNQGKNMMTSSVFLYCQIQEAIVPRGGL